jgi:ABC-type phosphate transport system substrate-binding protein
MNQKTITVATVLAAAMLSGIFATTQLAFADDSETNTEQKIKQSNHGSGSSTNINCADQDINSESPVDVQACGTLDVDLLEVLTTVR